MAKVSNSTPKQVGRVVGGEALLFDSSTPNSMSKDCRRLGGKRGVRSAECGVRSAECGVRSAECGVRSAECGVGSAECGVRSVENEECGK